MHFLFFFNKRQAKFFEDQMAALFGGAGAPGEAPSAEQFNLGFQRMAGESTLFLHLIYVSFNAMNSLEAAQLAASDGAPPADDATYVDFISQAIKVSVFVIDLQIWKSFELYNSFVHLNYL